MIDLGVAIDKLAGFGHADKIAEFLRGEGIKGAMLQSTYCPLARWLSIQTDRLVHVYPDEIYETKTYFSVYRPSEVITRFIELFDHGRYPELIELREPS